MRRAQVLDWGLQEQLWPHMEPLRPRPSIYIPEFIAANQSVRADNLIPGTRAQQVWPHPSPLSPATCPPPCHLLIPICSPVMWETCTTSPFLHPLSWSRSIILKVPARFELLEKCSLLRISESVLLSPITDWSKNQSNP